MASQRTLKKEIIAEVMRLFDEALIIRAVSGSEAMQAEIEDLMDELRQQFCIVIVTHSMAQAARVSQRTAFFHMGRLVEDGPTEEIFTNPRDSRTHDYITGRFG